MDKLRGYLDCITADLDRTVQFWLRYSHDDKYGGFFSCLGKDGGLYDDNKFGWLLGRQTWTYARLYNEFERFKKDTILEVAENGAKFLRTHVKDTVTGRCYFQLKRDGRPVKLQRTIFTECFYIMAMSELYKATRNSIYKEEATGMMNHVLRWAKGDDKELGRLELPGNEPVNVLAVPMMVLCLTEQLQHSLDETYKTDAQWAVMQILQHIQVKEDTEITILETVGSEGQLLPGCQGRLMNPGHAIECGWFLLNHAIRTNDQELADTAIKCFIEAPMSYGWDHKHGGLFYFLDCEGLSPTQLEWDMKLWWPHSEALIALLMAYKHTGREDILTKFHMVFTYVYEHFVDTENGEWFGYLKRQGEKAMDFKGGPFKGCFHVPRCLLLCEQMLQDMLNHRTGGSTTH